MATSTCLKSKTEAIALAIISLLVLFLLMPKSYVIGAENEELKGNICIVTICVQQGKTRELDALLSGGISAQGDVEEMQLPLYYAIVLDKPDCLYLLLKHKASVNHSWISDRENGIFPLSIAVEQSSVRCVELLLAFSVDVNAKNCKGNTSLYKSLVREDINIFKILSKSGARFSKEDLVNIDMFPRMKAWLQENNLK